MDLIARPLQLATSKPARQTLIHTFLITAATSILLGIAVFAYIIFYCNFVPQIEVEKVVHLQYGDRPHPYGIIPLGSELISRQAYDISLSLHLPRSPQNLARGNFMTALALLSPTYKLDLPHSQVLGISDLKSHMSSLEANDILFSFRRPAIMTFVSRLVSLSSRILTLPLYVFGLLTEAETLSVKIAEGVTFKRGWKNVPSLALLEIQAGQGIQVYDATILFKAKFSGLRWLMYNHRVISFVLFTGLFWISTIIFATIAWIALSIITASKNNSTGKNKFAALESPMKREITTDDEPDVKLEEMTTDEEPDLSDTPRNISNYSRLSTIRPTPKMKDLIEEEEYSGNNSFMKIEPFDEDEDEAEYVRAPNRLRTDSGIGTSLSESGDKISIRKRLTKQNS